MSPMTYFWYVSKTKQCDDYASTQWWVDHNISAGTARMKKLGYRKHHLHMVYSKTFVWKMIRKGCPLIPDKFHIFHESCRRASLVYNFSSANTMICHISLFSYMHCTTLNIPPHNKYMVHWSGGTNFVVTLHSMKSMFSIWFNHSLGYHEHCEIEGEVGRYHWCQQYIWLVQAS